MAGNPDVAFAKGESCDWTDPGNWNQHPQLTGPIVLTASPFSEDYSGSSGRFCVFFNPNGGIVPMSHPEKRTDTRWVKIYGDEVDIENTGSFQVFWQSWENGILSVSPEGSGFDGWLHDGRQIPIDSQGYCRMSTAYMPMGVCEHNREGVVWSFNPNPSQGHGIGRDGYYAGSHKLGNGFSGTMPGVYIQNDIELAVLLLANHNTTYPDGPHVSTTQHGGPQDVGWTYGGMLRPHRFFYSQPLLDWGVCMSVWWKYFWKSNGYTGDIPWRTNVRDPDYQMQSLIMLIRGKPIGAIGGTFT